MNPFVRNFFVKRFFDKTKAPAAGNAVGALLRLDLITQASPALATLLYIGERDLEGRYPLLGLRDLQIVKAIVNIAKTILEEFQLVSQPENILVTQGEATGFQTFSHTINACDQCAAATGETNFLCIEERLSSISHNDSLSKCESTPNLKGFGNEWIWLWLAKSFHHKSINNL